MKDKELNNRVPTVDYSKNGVNVHQATSTGYIFCPVGGLFDMSYPKSKLRRGRVQGNGQICPTLTCAPENLWIVDSIGKETNDDDMHSISDVQIRKLTEREGFRLMGVSDDDITKLLESGASTTQLYKMMGNSIVVDVLFHVFRTMFIEKESKKGKSAKLF